MNKAKRKKTRLKRYDPSYTWNRGGRLKELRIRHLARKFALKWKKSTFGESMITPSVARRHYDEVIKRDAFTHWRRIWWDRNKEWKLDIRATVHANDKLARIALNQWKEYVKIEQKEAKLTAKMADFTEQWTITRVLRHWIIQAANQKVNLERVISANQHYKRKVERTVLIKWRHKTRLSLIANQTRDRLLVRSQLNQIRVKLNKHKQLEMMMTTAQVHCEVRIVRQIFAQWRHNVVKMLKLKSLENQVKRNHQINQIKQTLKVWRGETNRKLDLNYLLSIALSNELDKRFIARKFIINWSTMAQLSSRYEVQIQKRAERLCGGLLHQWRQKTASRLKAADYVDRRLLRTSLTKWSNKLEWRQDADIREQLTVADEYAKLKLIVKFWHHWIDVKSRSDSFKKLEVKATEVYHLNLYGRILSGWQTKVIDAANYALLADKADQFRHDVLLSQLCYGMWRRADQIARCRSLSAKVDQFELLNRLRRSLTLIRTRIKAKRAQEKRLNWAHLHYQKQLIIKGFDSFKMALDERHAVSSALSLAVQFENGQKLKMAMERWLLYVNLVRQERQLNLTKMKHIFNQWRHKTAVTKDKSNQAAAFVRRKNEVIMKSCMSTWRQNAQLQAEQNFYFGKLIEQANDQFKRKVIEHASRHLFDKVIKKRESLLRCEMLEKRINQNDRCRQPLAKWRHLTRLVTKSKQLSNQALHFEQARLISLVVARHRQWSAHRQHVRLLINRADQFDRLSTTYRAMGRLRHVVKSSRHEKMATEMALTHLYQSITWNVLRRWKVYTQHQKQKSERYNEAFELHRQLEREQWCTQANQWASEKLRARADKAKREYGEGYYQLCRHVITKWRRFCSRKAKEPKKHIFEPTTTYGNIHAMGDHAAVPVTYEPAKFRQPRIPAFLATQPRTSSAIQATNESMPNSPVESSVKSESTPEAQIPLYFIDEAEYERKKKNESSGIGQVIRQDDPVTPITTSEPPPPPPPQNQQFRADLALHFELFHRQKEQLQRQLSYQTYLWQLNNSSLPEPIFNHSPLMMNTTKSEQDSSLGYFGHENTIEMHHDVIEPNTAWVMTSTSSTNTTTNDDTTMSPFTELDDGIIDEDEIQEMLGELDQLKIVIGRLKPSGFVC